jgi:Na+-transporting NADH:ubiquinone oxidoreductase subunit A
MSKDIKIKKGLNIRLKGEAEKTLSKAPRSRTFVIRPSEFHLITPKLLLKEGAKLKAGDVIFYSKTEEKIKFVSPVSGIIQKIERGAKRVITEIVIEADQKDDYLDHGVASIVSMDENEIKNHLLATGCWPFIKQRPYDIIANPDVKPKAIFVSAFSTAPLAADFDFTLMGKEKELQAAVSALSKLTDGALNVGVGKNSKSIFEGLKDVSVHKITGIHPAGNVGTLINKLNPVNKGEVVWTISPQDLVVIGELLLTGKFNAERIVALSGSSVKNPKYYTTKIGSEVSTILYTSGLNEEHVRIIDGNVLSGNKITPKGHLGYYTNTVTVIPEGDDYEFFGWNKPVFNKLSVTRALTFSWLQPKKEI